MDCCGVMGSKSMDDQVVIRRLYEPLPHPIPVPEPIDSPSYHRKKEKGRQEWEGEERERERGRGEGRRNQESGSKKRSVRYSLCLVCRSCGQGERVCVCGRACVFSSPLLFQPPLALGGSWLRRGWMDRCIV
ncbi:hypothetical protein IE53DRAFT_236044 [Violaceomyces palustris]|uniref:Uncharacterized protein n=1 Tax=Violaceomyces palustris TaxID=1673888 RepID=A0ACD0NPG5_9BASI|nr:hypothetical protein IE53DRAFT_236044 [Violaceomyces palustris]